MLKKIVTLALLTTLVYANEPKEDKDEVFAHTFSYGHVVVEDFSMNTFNYEFEVSFVELFHDSYESQDHDIYAYMSIDFNLKASDGEIYTDFGLGYRYKVLPYLQLGIAAGWGGLKPDDEPENDITGLSYGANAKLLINRSHSFIAKYSMANLSYEDGSTADATRTAIGYCYSF